MRTHRLTLTRIAMANPFPTTVAHEIAEQVQLRSQVMQSIAWHAQGTHERAAPAPSRGQLSGRATIGLLGAAALVAAALVAPALGLNVPLLPFFQADKAPEQVQLDFSTLNTGAPAGMSPQAIPEQTRRILAASFGGKSHTLWVAPTEAGGFCFDWTDGYGGCDATGAATIGAVGNLVPISGTQAPPILVGPNSTVGAATADAITKARSESVPTWVAGYVKEGDAQGIAIRLSDGSLVHLDVVWVSAPINAGFYSYDIPADKQTALVHVVAVDALAANGTIVKEQTLVPSHP